LFDAQIDHLADDGPDECAADEPGKGEKDAGDEQAQCPSPDGTDLDSAIGLVLDVDFAFGVLDDDGRIVQAEQALLFEAMQRLAHLAGLLGVVKGDHNQVRHFCPPSLILCLLRRDPRAKVMALGVHPFMEANLSGAPSDPLLSASEIHSTKYTLGTRWAIPPRRRNPGCKRV
jgi:hypothetical protein